MGRLPLVIADRKRLLTVGALTNARVGLENHGGGLSTADSPRLPPRPCPRQGRRAGKRRRGRICGRRSRMPARRWCHWQSRAADRAVYLRRPDLGRRLSDESLRTLDSLGSGFDVAIVLADGLSARAVEKHAPVVLGGLLERFAASGRTVGPVVFVRNGRVAVGDEIAAALAARMAIVLIGERPGLSSPESLGAYLTLAPAVGTPIRGGTASPTSTTGACGRRTRRRPSRRWRRASAATRSAALLCPRTMPARRR